VVKARKFEILTMNSEGLDEWRQFFEGANRTMFEVISNAITVAAKGHPEGIKLKRGEIVQTVYSSLFSLHCRHDHNDLTRPDKAERESFKVNLKMEVSKVIRMEMRLIWQKMVVRRLCVTVSEMIQIWRLSKKENIAIAKQRPLLKRLTKKRWLSWRF